MSFLENYFASPIHLLLLVVALPLVFYLARNSLAGLSAPRRWTSIVLRVLIVVLLVFALAEFRLLWKNDRLAVMFLLDRSASVPPEHQEAMLRFASDASRQRDRERGDVVGLISFGSSSGVEVAPRAEDMEVDTFRTLVKKDYTDIESAIRLAMAAFPDGYSRRLVLITDGNQNRGEALEEVRAAAAEGVSVDVLSVRYEHEREILLDKLIMSPEVHVGEPFDIRVVIDATHKSNVRLRLLQNQDVVITRDLELEPGKNFFSFDQTLDKGNLYQYEAIIEPVAGDDSVAFNNHAAAFTWIRGQPRVLLCTSDASADADFVAALESQKMLVDVLAPGELPADAGRFLVYGSIIFSNVGADEVTEEHMKMIKSLVEGAGIGFAMIGGDKSFGAGGYLGTPLEEVLPVNMDPKQKKKLPNGALAIVMHSCEINNGATWAKRTVQEAIRVLSPQDYAGVIYYGWQGQDQWLFPMLPIGQHRNRMLNLLNGFQPADMPSFVTILDKAFKRIDPVPAAIKHIVIFSDGDPAPPSAAQVQAIRAANVTISTICMGSHSRPVAMEKLAKDGGGRFHELTDPRGLPGIFIREAVTVRKSLIQEIEFQPIALRSGSYLDGIGVEALPALDGYVITSQKESADLFLVAPPSEEDPTTDPILSSWFFGLGKSVAFTSDLGSRWASDWTGWDNYRKFWAQIVRWVSRVQTDDRLRVTRELKGDTGILYIDAIDAEGNFIDGIDFESNVIAPDFSTIGALVRQVAPGRYVAKFPVTERGTYVATFKYRQGGYDRVFTTGLSVPYSPEYRRLATDDALLERLAEVSAGEVLDRAKTDEERFAKIFRPDFAFSRTPQEVWRGLLNLIAVLFLLDVFVRRVLVNYYESVRNAFMALAALIRRRPRPQVASDARLEALLKRKTEVQESRLSEREFYADGSSTASEEEIVEFDRTAVAGEPEVRVTSESTSSSAVAQGSPVHGGAVSEEKKEEGSYTSRLLAAKRRALRRDSSEDD